MKYIKVLRYSGEFGHVLTKSNNSLKCSCGQNDCLTTTSSREYITKRVIKRLEKVEHSSLEKIHIPDINNKYKNYFSTSKKSDELCISVLNVVISHLAYRIINYERIIDTETFIIVGGISFFKNYFFGELKKK